MLPVLAEDDALDAATNNPGQQRFEKLTAGLYLGDIARRIILRCCSCGGWTPVVLRMFVKDCSDVLDAPMC